MNQYRNIVRFVGVLFLVQMAAAVISYSVILDPLLYKANFLNEIVAHQSGVRVAMLLDLLCGASVFAIAVLLYPILKQFSERVALWYVGQRLMEWIGFVLSGVLILSLLRIGLDVESGTGLVSSGIEDIARTLRNARGHTQNISLLIYCAGAWSFYGLLFWSKLVPRFISIWGILGVTLLFIEILSNIFGTSVGGITIMLPLGLNEIFLGVWLIVKGFSQVLPPGLKSAQD